MAPDATKWAITEDGAGTVTIEFTLFGETCAKITSGALNNENSIMETLDLYTWGLDNIGTKKMRCEFDLRCNDLTGEFGAGFLHYATNGAAPNLTGTTPHAAIYCDNDVVKCSSGNGVSGETTTVSAYFSQDYWHKVLIEIDPTVDVKFIIDDVLRATHTTWVPLQYGRITTASRNHNGIQTTLIVKKALAWVA